MPRRLSRKNLRLPGLRRLARAVDTSQVEETAACARALTALFGKVPEVDPLPGGASRVLRMVETARVHQEIAPCPWPSALTRRTDPDGPAPLPPLGIHSLLPTAGRP